jgi:hypothetical protein
MKVTPDRSRKKEGFVLITVLLLAASLFFAAAFSLREAMNIFNEKTSAARRLRAENAAVQASAASAVWLKHKIGSDAGSGYFSPDAAPETSPLIELPDSFFSEFESIYHDHEFSCITADLHYAPSFGSEAARLGLPLMPPRIREDGSITRYFMQKTSAVSGAGYDTAASIIKIISCTRNMSGEISFRVENDVL